MTLELLLRIVMYMVLSSLLVYSAYSDYRTRRIPFGVGLGLLLTAAVILVIEKMYWEALFLVDPRGRLGDTCTRDCGLANGGRNIAVQSYVLDAMDRRRRRPGGFRADRCRARMDDALLGAWFRRSGRSGNGVPEV